MGCQRASRVSATSKRGGRGRGKPDQTLYSSERDDGGRCAAQARCSVAWQQPSAHVQLTLPGLLVPDHKIDRLAAFCQALVLDDVHLQLIHGDEVRLQWKRLIVLAALELEADRHGTGVNSRGGAVHIIVPARAIPLKRGTLDLNDRRYSPKRPWDQVYSHGAKLRRSPLRGDNALP